VELICGGTELCSKRCISDEGVPQKISGDFKMNSIIYLVGLVVVVMAILSFLGLH
jgi:hypothetical protein